MTYVHTGWKCEEVERNVGERGEERVRGKVRDYRERGREAGRARDYTILREWFVLADWQRKSAGRRESTSE